MRIVKQRSFRVADVLRAECDTHAPTTPTMPIKLAIAVLLLAACGQEASVREERKTEIGQLRDELRAAQDRIARLELAAESRATPTAPVVGTPDREASATSFVAAPAPPPVASAPVATMPEGDPGAGAFVDAPAPPPMPSAPVTTTPEGGPGARFLVNMPVPSTRTYVFTRGPRGGCFTYDPNNAKVYVPRFFCR